MISTPLTLVIPGPAQPEPGTQTELTVGSGLALRTPGDEGATTS